MKWTDFGLSKTVNERETFSISGVKGTMDWFAPEVFANEANQDAENKMRGTTKSDVFSEGCVFGYLLLDGQHPFGSTDAEDEIQSNILKENFVNLKRELNELNYFDLIIKLIKLVSLWILFSHKEMKTRGTPYAGLIINRMITKNPGDRITSGQVVRLLEDVQFKSKVRQKKNKNV